MGNDEYAIRLAEPDDIPSLASVERRAARLFEGWRARTGLTPQFLDNVSSVEKLEEARQRGHLWVATRDGEVVGFAQAMILDGVAHLDEIDVIPEHMRKGVGSRLVETVCQWAGNAGYSKITLSTFRDVPWNAPYYEKLGFHVVSTLTPALQELVDEQATWGLEPSLRVVMRRSLVDSRRSHHRCPTRSVR